MRIIPLEKLALLSWFVLFCFYLISCDTHQSGATPVGVGIPSNNNPSASEIASQVSNQLDYKLEKLENEIRQIKQQQNTNNTPTETLHEKGRGIEAFMGTVRELFPGMTEEEAQRYALSLLEHHNLPVPGIAKLGVKAKKASTQEKTPVEETPIAVKGRLDPRFKVDLAQYPAFPNEEAGADPSISAEDGGRGFAKIAEKLGYKTNRDYDLVNDPKALKGGSFSYNIMDYPSTLRPYGDSSNTWLNYLARDLMYETLLTQHHSSLEWIPVLASHWKLSDDQQTFWFRIDPNARWADGSPITSEDVVETWRLLVNPELQAPSTNRTYQKYDQPEALSKYLIKVVCNKPNWRNFMYFNAMYIFPAKLLKALPVKDWIKKYNFEYMFGSGAYMADKNELDRKQGDEVIYHRRKDYWAKDYRRNIGCFNFDTLRYIVVRDSKTSFEMVKAGELDCYLMTTAKWWIEDTTGDKFKRGLLLKRRFYSNSPNGVFGLCFNMKREPLNDLRVRKALTLLVNRKELLEKLMYNQYLPQHSYWAGGDYENPNNPKNNYAPEEALKLLAEAGWNERSDTGRLLKDGVPLELELLYSSPGLEKHLTLVQNTYAEAGINMTLSRVSAETRWKRVLDKDYQISIQPWGALHVPNPESSYKSDLADQKSNNNITAFANERVDELIEEYESLEKTQEERVKIIQEIDNILATSYPFALLWYGPFKRFIFWNKFGFPKGGMVRTERDSDTISWLWWFDPEKNRRLEAAKKDPSIKLEPGKTDDRYWLEEWKPSNK